jgi:hypothetical protein
VLLFGCDRALVDRLRNDSRWEAAVAEHSKVLSANMPDPRHWNLVVDDCTGENDPYRFAEAEALSIPFCQVTDEYMKEMSRARGIHFAGRRTAGVAGHLAVVAYPPRGHLRLEFNPTSEQAEVFADFVEEFETSFLPSYLDPLDTPHFPRDEILYCDAYDSPLLCLRTRMISWLFSIPIQDKGRRLAALEYLCYRTVPKLWPEVYSGAFQPRRVRGLEEERSRVAAELRERLRDLDEQIAAELAFFAPYFNLTVLGDDSLKSLVARAFEDVFSFHVTDLDELVSEGERKTLDLRLERESWSAFVEVRSRGNRNAQKTDVERLNEHYAEAVARHGPVNCKVLLFNGMYWRDPAERARHKTFDRPTVEEAEATGVCLVTAQQLLACIEAHRDGDLTVEALVSALSRPGLFALPS